MRGSAPGAVHAPQYAEEQLHLHLGKADEALRLLSALQQPWMRFRPEVTLTRLQLAELLLDHYPEERAEALEHLNFAIAEFRDMKMQPSLEGALHHKDILKA